MTALDELAPVLEVAAGLGGFALACLVGLLLVGALR